MEIETYEIEETVGETAGTTPEVEAEALELIEKLGLEGQRGLVVEKEDGEACRIPYPIMDDRERAVYGELYPEHQALASYKAGIIPLRVLQVAAHAEQIYRTLLHRPRMRVLVQKGPVEASVACTCQGHAAECPLLDSGRSA